MSTLGNMAKSAGKMIDPFGFFSGKAGENLSKINDELNGNAGTDRLNEAQNKRQEETYNRERMLDFRLAQIAERNSAANQKAGLAQAGFTPVLDGGISPAGGSAGSTSQPTGGNSHGKGYLDTLMATANLAQMQASTKNIEANTNKTEEETKGVQIENTTKEDTRNATHQAVISKLGQVQLDPNASDAVKDFAATLSTALETREFADIGKVVESLNVGVDSAKMSFEELRWNIEKKILELRETYGKDKGVSDKGVLGDLALMPSYQADMLSRSASKVSSEITLITTQNRLYGQQIENLKKELEHLGAQIKFLYSQDQNLRDSNLMNTWRAFSNGEIGGLETSVRLGLMFLNGFGFH